MNFEEKFNKDLANIKNDLAIENIYINDDDISMLRKYSNNEMSLGYAITSIIKAELN